MYICTCIFIDRVHANIAVPKSLRACIVATINASRKVFGHTYCIMMSTGGHLIGYFVGATVMHDNGSMSYVGT